MADLTVTETWETFVATDTPQFRDALSAAERDAATLQKSATNLLALARASVKASEAAIAARRELAQALAAAGGEAFAHPELSTFVEQQQQPPHGKEEAAAAEGGDADAAPLTTKALLELFNQMESSEAMQIKQQGLQGTIQAMNSKIMAAKQQQAAGAAS